MISTPRPSRLATRLTIIFFLAITALLVALTGAFALLVYNNQRANATALQRETAQRAAIEINAHLESLRAPLGGGAALCADVLCTSSTDVELWLHDLLAQDSAYLELALLDSQGQVMASVTREGHHVEQTGHDADRAAAFQMAQQGKPYLGPVRLLSNVQEPYVVMGEPLPKRGGALIAWINLRHVWEIVNAVRVGESGYVYVLDAHDRLIAYRDTALVLSGQNPVASNAGLSAHLQGPNDVGEYTGLNGTSVIGSHASIESAGWTVVVETPLTEAFAVLYRSLAWLSGLLVAAIIASALMARYLAKRLLDPVELLREGVGIIGAGHLDHKIVIETGDEIEELANEFNQMTQNLRRARSELEAWAHELERRVQERTDQVVAQKQQLAVLEERQRVARELHDSIAQLLFTLTLNLESAQAFLRKDPSRIPTLLERAHHTAKTATAEVRAMIYDLRPVALKQGELPETLREEFAGLAARTGITIEMQADGLEEIPPAVEDALFRIASEAVNNAVNHGKPSHVVVQLTRADHQVGLMVTDNGAGFDPTLEFPAHYGLKTMRERARGLGGEVTIESSIGGGTTVRAEIPLEGYAG